MKISEETASKLMAYLGSRPFSEVFQLVVLLQEDIRKNKETEVVE